MSSPSSAYTARSPIPKHYVFISYSRKDADFVTILARALHNYSAPRGLRVPNRRIDVFLDKQDFQTGDYNERLHHYLENSSKLMVICSPWARASRFVNQEIATFARIHGAQHIIPVLIQGIPNNESSGQNDAEMAFPDQLCALMEMPTAIDYRQFDATRDRITRGNFADPWFTLLAAIYDLSRAEVELREEFRNRRRRRAYWASALAAVLLAVLTVFVLAPRYRVQTALAAVSQAGGKVDSTSGYISVIFQRDAKAAQVDYALARLAALPRVDSLDLSDADFTTAGLSHLKHIRGIRELTVANTTIGDGGMQQIQSLHELRRLALDGTKISPSGLSHLTDFPRLENLNLTGLKLDPTVLAGLASLNQLRILSLSETGLSDRELSFLQSLVNLEELDISDNLIAGEGIQYLAPMRKLRKLDVDTNPLANSAMPIIGLLRSLRNLDLSETNITSTGLASLSGLIELRFLGLYRDSAVDDSGFAALSDLPNLQNVSLKETTIGDGTMRYLARQLTLQILSAPVTKVTDAGMAYLVNLPDLRELYLGGDPISDAGVESLLKIRTLRKLYLPSAQLTNSILPRFKELTELRELSVGGPGVTKAGFDRLKTSLPGVQVKFDEAPDN